MIRDEVSKERESRGLATFPDIESGIENNISVPFLRIDGSRGCKHGDRRN